MQTRFEQLTDLLDERSVCHSEMIEVVAQSSYQQRNDLKVVKIITHVSTLTKHAMCHS